jgi:hypothetical protein
LKALIKKYSNEIDLFLTRGKKKIAFECKASASPSINKGTYAAMQDTEINELFVVAPVKETYYLNRNVIVGNILHAIDYAKSK